MWKFILILAFVALFLPSAFAVPGQSMELIESSCGITECKALLQVKAPGQIMITRSPQFKFEFLSETDSIVSYTTRLGKQTEIEEPTYAEYCHKELVEDENTPMAFVQTDVCEWVQDWNKTTFRTKVDWTNDIFGNRIEPDTNYFIELTGKKRKSNYIGEFKVDWVMTFNGHTYSEWAWWNANWLNRKQIYIPNNVDLNTGDTVTVQVDYTAITIRSDFYDVRVYDANTDVEIGRAIEGSATDSAGYVGFLLNHGIIAGQTDVNYYYLYYNNAAAGAPTDANAALTKVCTARFDACQFAAPVTRGTDTIIYGIASLEGTGAGRTRSAPTLGAYRDFNYSVTVNTEDVTKLTGMSIAYGASNGCTGVISGGNMGYYAAGGFNIMGAASNDTTYGMSIHYIDGASDAAACKYTWYDADGVAIVSAADALHEGGGGTITGIVIYLNDGGGDNAFADNVYLGLPAFSPGLGDAEAPNAAPYMTSIDLNAALAKQNDHIKVTVAGTGDAESEALTLLCGTSANPTVDTNNFCTSFSIPSPYTTVSCTGNGAAGDGLQTVYCRLYDLSGYSSDDNSDTYTADNTAPVVGAMVFDGFILSYTGGFIDGSGTFFATADANYCEYSLDDTTWTSGTFDGTYCVSPTIVISNETSYAFNQRGFDGVGNVGTGTAVNYIGKEVLVDPENIEDTELINASWTLVYKTFAGLAFAFVVIVFIILAVIVLKAFFN